MERDRSTFGGVGTLEGLQEDKPRNHAWLPGTTDARISAFPRRDSGTILQDLSSDTLVLILASVGSTSASGGAI